MSVKSVHTAPNLLQPKIFSKSSRETIGRFSYDLYMLWTHVWSQWVRVNLGLGQWGTSGRLLDLRMRSGSCLGIPYIHQIQQRSVTSRSSSRLPRTECTEEEAMGRGIRWQVLGMVPDRKGGDFRGGRRKIVGKMGPLQQNPSSTKFKRLVKNR